MKKLFIYAAFTTLLLSCSSKDDPKPPVGSTGKYDFSAVDKFLMDHLSVYGNHVAILVSQNGQVIYKQQINLAINSNLPIASASKWLSASVIMKLVDEHKLSLDDTVGKYLPIFTQNHKGNITIRQLFSLTAGFEGEIDADNIASKPEYHKDFTLAQAVDSIAVYSPLINPPGKAFNYCSTSMQIAGRIAELVSGESWQALFNKKIAGPCHMTAQYLQMSAQNPLIAGGVHTTAQDYLNFLQMIVNKGLYNGTRVLSEDAIATMELDQTRGAEIQTTPYVSNVYSPFPTSPVRYGIGNWRDEVDNSGNAVETSSPGLFGTHPWQDSKHLIAGIIFTRTEPRKSANISLQIRQMIRDIVDKSSN
ncbi:serine hydrolase domain-containing protein [Mucilaginibacter sabulilitoris]|uniref:Serine hydrolase domain-containing protein n=1 Tax=Mucilaginibacter sabulilitoris TaxID=1173583 RepID=A0ABZ0TGW0_9SPHI|nr:serine hydrolase domain-containing protein [Mucilaginibacter sabulilitoris]WPU92041.1 serine hydrolase domain-containing protein [Mucilaginibacter sabulilitoris]